MLTVTTGTIKVRKYFAIFYADSFCCAERVQCTGECTKVYNILFASPKVI